MTEEISLNQAWGAIRVVLQEAFSFNGIKNISGLAGIDVTGLAHLVQRQNLGATKGELISALDCEVDHLNNQVKAQVLIRFAEAIVDERPDFKDDLERNLERLGWQLECGNLVPIEIFDITELKELPEPSKKDLIKAAKRLREGDLNGALSSACAAVDSVIEDVYSEHGIKSQPKDGFQVRYKTALRAKGTINRLKTDLSAKGWENENLKLLINNVDGALTQGAKVMEILRRTMSDIHGSKEVYKPLVFDSLKWAALIIRMLK